MIAIFDEKKVFKLVCPDQAVADKMKDEKEITVEIKKWQKFMMPTLVISDDGEEQIVWVSRKVFDLIRNPPTEQTEPEEPEGDVEQEGDVDMA